MIPRLNETVTYSNISATTAAFSLKGGVYGITATGTWGGGSLTLQRLAFNGSTYVTALTAIAADGYTTVTLPPGTYKLAVATATAVYVDITAIATAT
ncbi:hypothetical protein IVA86_33140 [Bradyrhizobium sp. 146]|uniref:hypothetical protein n=1 Tax=Bradyrhizobium sp. 146 TaxID=2782622 RepID=UPI001FFBC42A|nr:hypothetical protein [Bradyrhizobium sp. 146]MCK1706119.1 hypothetical protein [Bradyrhizobium sp. 146]